MNKTLKWILGILLVLVLIGAMFAIGFMWQTHMAGGRYDAFERNGFNPMLRGQSERPMMGGYLPFFGGLFLLGGLVKVALFVGLLYGAYWLGRRNTRLVSDPAPAPRVDAPAAPEAIPAPAPRKRANKTE